MAGDEDWREEERRKALKWAKWAYLMLGTGWCITFWPAVYKLWHSANAFELVVHALGCILYSFVFPFMARTTMSSVRSLKEAEIKPPKTL